MTRKAKLELRKLWRKRIERQHKSGLTVAAFCRQERVSTATFYGWKRKLRGGRALRPKRTAKPRSAEAVGSAAGNAPEARGQAAFLQLPVSPVRANPWIELVLAEGTIIRVPQQNMRALHTVLQALGGTSYRPVLGEPHHA
jgi:hypothetical protein